MRRALASQCGESEPKLSNRPRRRHGRRGRHKPSEVFEGSEFLDTAREALALACCDRPANVLSYKTRLDDVGASHAPAARSVLPAAVLTVFRS